jgi:uncharacterized protein DUF4035
MTTRQFCEWRAYYDLEPFGEERADYRSAQVVATLLNVHRKRGSPLVKLAECLLKFGSAALPRTQAESVAQIQRAMEILVQIHNAPSEKKKKESKPRIKRLRD